jgi:hypothetical protein
MDHVSVMLDLKRVIALYGLLELDFMYSEILLPGFELVKFVRE